MGLRWRFPGLQLILPQLGEALLQSLLPRPSRGAPAASCTARGSRHPWGGFGATSSPNPFSPPPFGAAQLLEILQAWSRLGLVPSRCSSRGCANASPRWRWDFGQQPRGGLWGGPGAEPSTSSLRAG